MWHGRQWCQSGNGKAAKAAKDGTPMAAKDCKMAKASEQQLSCSSNRMHRRPATSLYRYGGRSGDSAGMLEFTDSDFAPLGSINMGARSNGSERAQLRHLKSTGFTPRQKIKSAAARDADSFRDS